MEPINSTFQDGTVLYSVPPPGSGAILAFILNILDGYNFNASSIENMESAILTYHRMIEAFKYAYAKRTELGDTQFVDIKEASNENIKKTTFHCISYSCCKI